MTALKSWFHKNRNDLIFCASAWAFSRGLLYFIAWFSAYFAGNDIYQRYIERGYFLSPKWWIDIWCRWDSEWHLSIVRHGYLAPARLGEDYSNMAFFPMYPGVVRLLTFPLPQKLQTESVYLLTGLILSNLCLIFALLGIMKIARAYYGEGHATPQKAVALMLCLPAGFFFSAFYSEGLFLCLIVYAFFFAKKEKWAICAFFATCAALTRPHGILILLPILWIYMRRRQWRLSEMGRDWLWFLGVPVGICAFFFHLSLKTGDFFAFFKSQAAWGRSLGIHSASGFFREYLSPLFTRLGRPTAMDLAFIILALVLSLLMFFRMSDKAPAIYALSSVLVLILTGNLFSMTRYVAAIFPIWIFVAGELKQDHFFHMLCLSLATIQCLLFCGWVNYYWVA